MEFISGMIGEADAKVVLDGLARTRDIPGDVVELGCNVGTMSLHIRRYLDSVASTKTFHVYDSFQGLPARSVEDGPVAGNFVKGACYAARDWFEANFQSAGLTLPVIHEGWFAEQSYPDVVSFAFFDGDLYRSTMDSFERVWPRLSPGGIVVVHDVTWAELGAKRACEDFLGLPVVPVSGCGVFVKSLAVHG